MCYPSQMKHSHEPQQRRETEEHTHAQALPPVNKSSSVQHTLFTHSERGDHLKGSQWRTNHRMQETDLFDNVRRDSKVRAELHSKGLCVSANPS